MNHHKFHNSHYYTNLSSSPSLPYFFFPLSKLRSNDHNESQIIDFFAGLVPAGVDVACVFEFEFMLVFTFVFMFVRTVIAVC